APLPDAPTVRASDLRIAPVDIVRTPKLPAPMPEPLDVSAIRRPSDVRIAPLPVTSTRRPQAPMPEPLDPSGARSAVVRINPLPAGKAPRLPAPMPDAPVIAAAGGSTFSGDAVRNLIAVSVNPAPPKEQIDILAGNRTGSFEAGAGDSRNVGPQAGKEGQGG